MMRKVVARGSLTIDLSIFVDCFCLFTFCLCTFLLIVCAFYLGGVGMGEKE